MMKKLAMLSLILALGAGAANAQSVFQSVDSTDGTLKNSTWLGWIDDTAYPWTYHFEHGWIYPFGESESALWLYMYFSGEGEFVYTGLGTYPWMYSPIDQEWVYYYEGTSDPRWFESLAEGTFAIHDKNASEAADLNGRTLAVIWTVPTDVEEWAYSSNGTVHVTGGEDNMDMRALWSVTGSTATTITIRTDEDPQNPSGMEDFSYAEHILTFQTPNYGTLTVNVYDAQGVLKSTDENVDFSFDYDEGDY